MSLPESRASEAFFLEYRALFETEPSSASYPKRGPPQMTIGWRNSPNDMIKLYMTHLTNYTLHSWSGCDFGEPPNTWQKMASLLQQGTQ